MRPFRIYCKRVHRHPLKESPDHVGKIRRTLRPERQRTAKYPDCAPNQRSPNQGKQNHTDIREAYRHMYLRTAIKEYHQPGNHVGNAD